ncbi:MAG: hypothetical protein M0P11_00855 [Anaerolineaceae bacterium]|nr:hypothetical protein [Anaerolineaceae bacterium]
MTHQRQSSLYLNRFSILLAFLAFGFALVYLLPVDLSYATSNILGFRIQLNYYSFIPLLLALLSAVGAVWVFSTHPIWHQEKPSLLRLLPHLMLPFISSMILTIVLRQSARSLTWWVVYLTGYVIVALLLRAEYVLIEEAEINSPGYSILVTSFSFGQFLLFTISLKNSDIRMIAQFLLLFLSSMFVSYRLLGLRGSSPDNFLNAMLASWLVTQLAVGLHYIFIRPIQYGLLLTGLLYSLSSLFNQLKAEKRWYQYLEPLVMAGVTIVLIVVSSIV